MIRNLIIYMIFPFLCLCLSSCKNDPNTLQEYREYINDPKNGFIRERIAGPFLFELMHVPPKFMALREVEHNHASYDSIYSSFTQSYNFQFTISPNPEKATGDVTRASMHNLEQYDQRLRTLNFHLKEYWTLETPSGPLHPILTQLEQTGGLTDYRRIQLAFTSPDSASTITKPWILTFDDEIWSTGVNRWRWE